MQSSSTMSSPAQSDNVKYDLTREERDQLREKCLARLGYDPTISEDIADSLRARISTLWLIEREQFTGHRLSFVVMPLMSSRQRQLWDMESELMKEYGNAPHKLGTRFTQYALEFFAN